ncbi:hypothetical protein B0H34DRAFT_798611 [Crassisporium funariophilum]|nr:hypothetical protein B0H34DRAFT_798611 [Crassisporium funariophilum]
MASAPPVPPRPYESTTLNRNGYPGPPPPLPPLPPDLRLETERYNTPSPYEIESPPHFENPLIAPRPHRLDPSIPANMARSLDDQIYQQRQQPQHASVNYTPGFSVPAPPPPPQQQQQQQNWSPWAHSSTATQNTNYPPPQAADLAQSMANLALHQYPSYATPPTSKPTSPPPQQQPPSIPSLTAPLPILEQLVTAANAIQSPTHDPALKIAWCRDVFFLIERGQHTPAGTDPPIGPLTIPDPALARLAHIAVPLVLQLANSFNPGQGGTKMPVYIAEAIGMRATLAATGAFPEYVRHNPRTAFRDFEASARGGHAPAWFRLGRDYENFNDHAHARECFERGAKLGVESCLYRMGMAHLLGQLSLPSSPTLALPLLHRSATLASLTTPQPAYVYALLLLAEFTQITLPPLLFAPFIPQNSSPTLEARKHLERAAFLHFPAAQYKLGHAYEFAEAPFPFEPLLSVQYYSLASQAGEVEADMALSKWFLCGSGGAANGAGGGAEGGGFEKDEGLALTFADKAARKGLPSAEFAMGYYAEVGVGGPKDLKAALMWYSRAKEHGNPDAAARLLALSAPTAQTLSRQEHDTITETKLVRRRTLAAQRAETQPLSPPWDGQTFPTIKEQQQAQAQQQQGGGRRDGRLVVDVIRKNSLAAGGYTQPLPQPPQQSAVGRLAGVLESPGSQRPPQQQQQQYQGQQTPPQQNQGQGRNPANQWTDTYTPGGSRRTESPQRQQQGGSRTQSPSRLPIGPSGGGGGGGRSSSPARPGAAPTGGRAPSPGRGKLAKMRLNLEDPGPLPSSSSSASASASFEGRQGLGTPGTAMGTGVQTPGGALATPRPTQMQTPGGGGGKYPQTFAEMGFQGAKAEDEKCVIM